MNFTQGQFDFDKPGDDSGYRNWQAELKQQQIAFEKRWGVRLDKPVRLRLQNQLKSIEGTIHLDPTHHPKPGQVHRLLIGRQAFLPNEIESLVLLD